MSAFLQKNWFKLAITIILLSIIASFAYKLWVSNGNGTNDKHLDPVMEEPSFEFTRMDGQKVGKEDLKDTVHLVYFFFGQCPDVCPVTNDLMRKIQNQLKEKNMLGDKVKMLSITFDPERDTPEFLKEYAKRYQADPAGWWFLRDDHEKVKDMMKKLNMTIESDGKGYFLHSNTIFLVDRKGMVRTNYTPGGEARNELDIDAIVRNIKTLTKEK